VITVWLVLSVSLRSAVEQAFIALDPATYMIVDSRLNFCTMQSDPLAKSRFMKKSLFVFSHEHNFEHR
jgi:hypothetical protein